MSSSVAVLYSRVADRRVFEHTGFYSEDTEILRQLYSDVVVTNSLRVLWKSGARRVVGYFYSYSALMAVVVRLRGGVVVLTGGADNLNASVETRWAKRLVNRAAALVSMCVANAILVPSSADYANFVRLSLGVARLRKKIYIVPHTVPMCDSLLGCWGDRNEYTASTICWMGTEGNVRRKGLFRIVELVARLRDMGVMLHVSIAGRGATPPSLVIYVRNFDLEAQVRFIGGISDKEKLTLLTQSRFYFQLSEYEGFGVAALEALSAGCIVVHSGRGALAETIGNLGVVCESMFPAQASDVEIAELWSRMNTFKPNPERVRIKINEYTRERRRNAIATALAAT